jgi:hypothetical protein
MLLLIVPSILGSTVACGQDSLTSHETTQCDGGALQPQSASKHAIWYAVAQRMNDASDVWSGWLVYCGNMQPLQLVLANVAGAIGWRLYFLSSLAFTFSLMSIQYNVYVINADVAE